MQQQVKRNFIILALVLILAVIGYVAYSYSYVSITGTEGETTHVLINQSDGSRTTTTTDKPFKKLVKRGTYEVISFAGKKNYWQVAKAGGFFTTTTVNATLQSEKYREFIGGNPHECMQMLGQLLTSSPCQTWVDEINIHMPADSQRPPFVAKLAGPAAEVEAIIPTASGWNVVVKTESDLEDEGTYHASYSVITAGKFDTASFRKLAGLSGNLNYTFTPFDEGWLAASSNGDLSYFKNLASKPEAVEPKLKPSNIPFHSATSKTDEIVTVYSTQETTHNLATPGGIVADDEGGEKIQVRIVYQKDGESASLELKEPVIRALLCGASTICVHTESGRVHTYKISGNRFVKEFTVIDALGMAMSNDRFYIAKKEGVTRIDLNRMSGSLAYSLSGHEFCGITGTPEGFIVCVASQRGTRRALQVQVDKDVTDEIEQKIATLENSSLIKSVSVYKSIIYVVPELGKIEYQSSIGGFGYDPALRSQTAKDIDSLVAKLGLNKPPYTIINPLR